MLGLLPIIGAYTGPHCLLQETPTGMLISIRQLFYFALLLSVLSFPPPICNLGQPTAGLEAVWLGYLCGVHWKAGESHCRSLKMQPVFFHFRSLCFANVPHCTGCLCVCMSYVLFDCNFLKLPPSSRLPKTGPNEVFNLYK